MNAKALLPAFSILLGILATALQVVAPKGIFHYQDELLTTVALVAMLGAIGLGILNYKNHRCLSFWYVIVGVVLLLLGLFAPAWFPARESCPQENRESGSKRGE